MAVLLVALCAPAGAVHSVPVPVLLALLLLGSADLTAVAGLVDVRGAMILPLLATEYPLRQLRSGNLS